MSLARAAVLRHSRVTLAALPRRYASTPSSSVTEHEHHDEHHQEDTTVYPPETFVNKFWRNFLLVTIGGLAIYKYAPSPSDDAFFSRLVAHYKPAAQLWTDLSNRHLAQSADVQDHNLLIASAKIPPVHRYRFPQALERHSPFIQPVGMSVDMSGVVVKMDKE